MMLKGALLLVVFTISTNSVKRTKRSDLFDFYQSHVIGHYLHNDGKHDQSSRHSDPGEVRKREVKLSKGGLFYHEGPYVAHGQVQRQAPKLDSHKPGYQTISPRSNLPHRPEVTPDPFHAHPNQYINPSTIRYHAVTTPSPVQYHSTPYHGYSTPAPQQSYPTQTYFHGSPTPIPYIGSPTPYYPSPTPYHITPAPYYGTPTPYHRTPTQYHGTPKYHTASPSPYHGDPTPFPATPTPYHGTPTPHYGTPTPHYGTPTSHYGTPTPHYGTPISYHVTPPPHYPAPSSYPTFHSLENHNPPSHSFSHPNSAYKNPPHPTPVQKNDHADLSVKNPYTYRKTQVQPNYSYLKHNKLISPPQHVGTLSFAEQEVLKSGPPQPVKLAMNPETIPQRFEPVMEDLYKLHKGEVAKTETISQGNPVIISQPTLFQTITQEAPDRPARTKLSEKSYQIPKSDALQMLMAIAGDNWDAEIGIEKNLLDTASDNYICPAPEGHFPDPDSCSVYFQCAQGNPHKRTCEPGLNWNMSTNQCDWKANVDCSRNSVYL